jgi:nitrite reductase (NO-forming)
VADSHRIARRAFLLGAVFALAAVVWAAIVVVEDWSWWGPLHSFLLGTVLLAISGATQLFTVTWSAAPAPAAVTAAVQRWLLALGAAAVILGMARGWEPLVWVGSASVAASLVLLGASLVLTVRRSLLRRFDLSARFYLLALACGLVGVTLGALMAGGMTGGEYLRLRAVHSHLNLVGLMGFTIVGTLPTLLATFAHHPAVSGREAVAGWWLSLVAAAAIVSHLVAPPWVLGVGVGTAGAAAVLVSGGILLRLRSKLMEAGLPLFQVVAGVGWLVLWSLVGAFRLVAGAASPAFGAWTLAAVVGGVGQVLAGSLAYLVPVLLGPGNLGANLERMTRRGWIPLVLANVAVVAALAGWSTPGAFAAAGWVADFAWRLVGLRRQPAAPGTSSGEM